MIPKLVTQWERFAAPGRLARSLIKLQKFIALVSPEKVRQIASRAVDAAMDAELIKLALEHAAKGFGELTKRASSFTLSPDGVVQTLRSDGHAVYSYDYICAMRSYQIERSLTRRDWKDLCAALVEGAATGAPGFIGVPFNLALSFLLYFGATQSTALYYGYDVRNDPHELQFASEVTLSSLEPNLTKGAETLGGLIGKMMLAAELSALSTGLKKTYTQMAGRGGAQLLYVQIRALANKAAEKALKNSGSKSIEASVFRNMLEQVAKRLPKEAGKKAVPLLGAVIGGFCDTYLMHRVLTGANLIYHKRYLHEKGARVDELFNGNGGV